MGRRAACAAGLTVEQRERVRWSAIAHTPQRCMRQVLKRCGPAEWVEERKTYITRKVQDC
jgi:hypothetical protein